MLRRQSSLSAKATAVLKRIKFFQELEPGVQAKLPSIVNMQHLVADTVIFQQDDPPGNCYVLLSGEVGVYARPEEEPDDEDDSRAGSRRVSLLQKHQAKKAAAEAERARLVQEAADALEKQAGEDQLNADEGAEERPPSSCGEEDDMKEDEEAEGKAARLKVRGRKVEPLKAFQTTEGFSVWSDIEDLGKQVALIHGGTIFGELALIKDQLRGASIRCLTDCDLLVIRRSDFDRVLKEEMRRAGDDKLNFLFEHLPGMRDVEVPRQIQGKGQPHPAYYLRRATYRRGHRFLIQGTIAQDAIFVISTGCVEISHKDPSAGSTAVGFRRRPQANRGRSVPMNYAAKAAAALHEAENTERSDVPKNKGGPRCLGTFMRGSVFGNMPVQAPEPYTVVVSSPSCEVFQAVGSDVQKLPRRLLEVVREYIANSTAWRLQTYMNHASPVELPKARQRSESPPVCERAKSQKELRYFSLIHTPSH